MHRIQCYRLYGKELLNIYGQNDPCAEKIVISIRILKNEVWKYIQHICRNVLNLSLGELSINNYLF